MKKSIWFVMTFCLALGSGSARALDIGDPAPEIAAETWVSGEPADPTKPDGKTIYLVEVWSVSCPPCVRSVPMLGELQKRYADQGLKIVSFTDDDPEEVRSFLQRHPMGYSSFIDRDGVSIVNYMAADNRNTIPHAFLFDRSGALVWTGNPLDNLENRVRQVIDGRLDLKKALALREAGRELEEVIQEQDLDGIAAALTKLQELEPDNPQHYQLHYRLLAVFGGGSPAEAGKLLRAWHDACADNPLGLTLLATAALEQGEPAYRNPELALAAARRAYSLGGETRLDAGLALAEVYKGLGRPDLSARLLEELIREAEAEQAGDLGEILGFYKRLAELGKTLDSGEAGSE